MLTLRNPRPDEAAVLTDLCLRSKAVWGYDEAFMQACRDELTFTAKLIQSSRLQIAQVDGCLIGVTQVTLKGRVAELDKLFVEPPWLRSGAGRRLFGWAKTMASEAGAVTLIIEADPDAAGFYRRMGAVDDGLTPGSIPGRLIPKLKLML
jgi:GNAT superfamily N-acetyltransferase